jgi:hypothetical protein
MELLVQWARRLTVCVAKGRALRCPPLSCRTSPPQGERHRAWTFSVIAALLALALPPFATAAAEQVDLELVLAVDVSRSIDADEAALQRAGYIEAIRHPDFLRAIKAGYHGRIAISYFEWAGNVRQDSIVPWHIIDSEESAAAFADRIGGNTVDRIGDDPIDRLEALAKQLGDERFAKRLGRDPSGGLRGTSISSALTFATGFIAAAPFAEERSVIDVSGDGPNNAGSPVEEARDAALSAGIVINGLPLLIRPSPTYPHLDRYYADCVIGGPGSFMLPVYDASEFTTAIRRKLILEVSGAEPPARIIPAADDGPTDCLKGERDRRLFSDPFFPELDK